MNLFSSNFLQHPFWGVREWCVGTELSTGVKPPQYVKWKLAIWIQWNHKTATEAEHLANSLLKEARLFESRMIMKGLSRHLRQSLVLNCYVSKHGMGRHIVSLTFQWPFLYGALLKNQWLDQAHLCEHLNWCGDGGGERCEEKAIKKPCSGMHKQWNSRTVSPSCSPSSPLICFFPLSPVEHRDPKEEGRVRFLKRPAALNRDLSRRNWFWQGSYPIWAHILKASSY